MYGWNARKNGKQHIIGADSMSLCKTENGGTNITTMSVMKNDYRKVCRTCIKKLDEAIREKKPVMAKAKKGDGKKRRKAWLKSKEFLKSREWRELRYDALKLNNGCCELCGRSKHDGIVLNVDHIKPRSKRPDLALKRGNLQVLCGTCNHGKGNRDDTDWREPSLAKLMGEAV